MIITAKQVVTKVNVEITFQEFWAVLEDIVNEFNETGTVKPMAFKGSSLYLSALKRLVQVKERYDTMEGARSIFENPLSDIRTLVVAQIAEDNGYQVQFYGYNNKVAHTLNCVFTVEGSHIE